MSLPQFVRAETPQTCSVCSLTIEPGTMMVVYPRNPKNQFAANRFRHHTCADPKTRIAQRTRTRKRRAEKAARKLECPR